MQVNRSKKKVKWELGVCSDEYIYNQIDQIDQINPVYFFYKGFFKEKKNSLLFPLGMPSSGRFFIT